MSKALHKTVKTSTRLILILTVLVGLILAAGSFFRLHQREMVLQQGLRNEIRAQALTLQIALENLYRGGRTQEAQQLIDSLSQNPRVYGVLIFDDTGQVLLRAGAWPATVSQQTRAEALFVSQSGEPVEITRRFAADEVFCLLMPLKLGAGRRGAFELAQSSEFINAERARGWQDVLLVTLPLFAAILLAVLMVMRVSVVRPIQALVRGAAALGRGDLNYRVQEQSHGSELAQLAHEFNRMADGLAEQQRAAAREADRRLQLERELRDTERLAAVGRLAAGVAHEIGTPLNVIDARAEQLQERAEAPLAVRQRNLTIIRAQTERITRLVRQLLNLARPFKLRRAPIAATHLIAGVVELLEADAARAHVEISVHQAAQVHFDVDAELIHQVLLNICQNALQAMPHGGRLWIECAAPVLYKNGQGFACLNVHDTGPGIPSEHLAHIFDPFFTTKDVGSGTGLGLAVSRRIIEEHGGWIIGANQSRGGAKFSVHLPVAAQNANMGQAEKTVQSEQPV